MDVEFLLLKKLTQSNLSKVSKDTGISRNSIYGFLNGKTITSQNIFKLLRYFENWEAKVDPEKIEKFKILLQFIISHYDPEQVMLFGSQIRGDWNRDSDFDIFIIQPKIKMTDLYSNTVGLKLNFTFDYFVYTKAMFLQDKSLIHHNVINEMKVIYDRSQKLDSKG